MAEPRILLTAAASGSGKTLVTCGILQALTDRGMKAVSFKCGPDYIDPMFHETVIGTKARNLDTFFTDEDTTRWLFKKHAAGADISVMEGVMGFYDGLGGISTKASAYDLARTTQTPAVLIVNCRGMSVSIVPYIKGFLEYRSDSNLKGVILNQMSAMLYPEVKKLIEAELPVQVLGYVPKVNELALESRHLGLVLPEEIPDLKDHLRELAQILEKSLDLDALIELAKTAPEIEGKAPTLPEKIPGNPVIAVARDEAFCFLYQDNLELLEDLGAEIRYFSPLRDGAVPADADGMLLPGGYPELHMDKLAANESMRASIREAVAAGMPCMAECGGFMYLQQETEDLEGKSWPAAGAIEGKAFHTAKLSRFGYICLTPQKGQMLGEEIGEIRGHEFHYFDSTACGDSFKASKPLRKRTWECIQGTDTLIAGFPHLYYYSNPNAAAAFVRACAAYGEHVKEERR